MAVEQLATDMCVTPNAHVRGRISGRKRQIDVLIDARHDTDNSRRLIIDAKHRKRKVDVKDVESFRGLMEDVHATHGYLVCPTGHTKAAERRAQQAVSIRLIPLDRLEGFDPSTWPTCKADHCAHGRVFWDGYPEFAVKLQPLNNGAPMLVSAIHCVGKCDRCGRFHVHCLTCGDVLLVPESDPDDYGHQCGCRPAWFWLASIEQDPRGAESAELHAIFLTHGRIITVDRRSL
jgi:hypothetical protein